MKRSKKYLAAKQLVDNQKKYSLEEALQLLPKLSISKFNGSVELEVQLKLSEKQKKESIRGNYSLPNQFTAATKVLVFAEPTKVTEAKSADVSGGEELIEKVEKGEVEFDVIIATPAMMPKIARLGKTLGRKGLMPSPKNGTITNDLEKAIKRFKSGLTNFQVKNGKITAVIGKLDMKPEELAENYLAVMEAIRQEITRLGGDVIGKVTLSPTMGPAVKIA